MEQPSARALLVFPTKALARDQVESLRELAQCGERIGVAVYDGDTPPDERRAARLRAAAVATNPDMLHRGMLPHHERWAHFFAGLRYLVLDELHTYRGIFGSHVANVVQRLWRICTYHGSRPQVIACSATIANARELAESVCGRPDFVHIDEDCSPAGSRTFVVLNPKVVDQQTGVRRSYLKVARRVASELRASEVPTLAFCRTRKAVELLTRYLREDEVADDDASGGRAHERAERKVRGYRGGYLPDLRREVEHALRTGEAKLVATTNALELGMDIGGLDAVVLAGYPGTRAATLQRAGRAGRRGRPAFVALVLSSDPIDQFIAASPGFVFDEAVEQARVDPHNPDVLLPHLRCAALELPLSDREGVAGLEPHDLRAALDYLVKNGALHREQTREGELLHYIVGGSYPADAVDLRGTLEENFAVVHDDGSGEVLAEVAYEDGALYLHPGAIYPLEGRTYEVERLEWDARKAYVRAVTASYYTEAIPKLRVRIVDREDGPAGVGYAHLCRMVPAFKKLRFRSHENIGAGPIRVPDLELHTVAAFWDLPETVLRAVDDPERRANAALGAAWAIHHVAAMMLMCDAPDLGHAVVASDGSGVWSPVIDPVRGPGPQSELHARGLPRILLYDNLPGGAGLSPQAHALGAGFFERVIATVGGCPCRSGCPTCMGPMWSTSPPGASSVGRADVLAILTALGDQARA